jgi:ribosome assembly protein SQT1
MERSRALGPKLIRADHGSKKNCSNYGDKYQETSVPSTLLISMSSSNPTHDESDDEQQETFLDPNESFEEYTEDQHPQHDHPMSDDEEDDHNYDDQDGQDGYHDMLAEELIVDDSIQGFFLHTSPIYSVALYDNWAATGSGDDLGYLWDVANGELIMKLDGHTDSVTIVKFSSDGTFLATGGMDGQVRIWNVSEKKLVVELEAGDEIMVSSLLLDV